MTCPAACVCVWLGTCNLASIVLYLCIPTSSTNYSPSSDKKAKRSKMPPRKRTNASKKEKETVDGELSESSLELMTATPISEEGVSPCSQHGRWWCQLSQRRMS